MSRDLEKTVAWTMEYCQHYNMRGMPKACDAGVEYETVGKFSGANPANLARAECRPCIGGHNMPDATTRCPKWLRATREQGVKRHADFEKAMRDMEIVGPVVAAWRTWTKKNRVDKDEVIECPVCKGGLHLSQSSYNGHVWGRCATAECVSWME